MSMIRRLSAGLSKEGIYAALATIGVAILGLRAYSDYRDRGPWYVEYGSGDAILIAVLVGSIATFAAVGNFLDIRRRRLLALWLVPLAVVFGSVLFIAGCWFYPRPSVAAAEASLAIQDLERAGAEIAALEARNPGSPEVAALRARLDPQREKLEAEDADDRRLASIGDAGLAIDTTLVLRRTWHDLDKRELARRRVLERARALAKNAWERGDGPALAKILEDTAGLEEDFTRETTQRAALAYARGCMDHRQLDCVREALGKLEADDTLEPDLQAIREGLEGELLAAEGEAKE
jgi:hypothetical protein